jgi:hypothetical protein
MNDLPKSEFEKVAAEQKTDSLLADFWHFLRENKKFWLIPILLAVLLLGAFIWISGTGAAPFIYTLF